MDWWMTRPRACSTQVSHNQRDACLSQTDWWMTRPRACSTQVAHNQRDACLSQTNWWMTRPRAYSKWSQAHIGCQPNVDHADPNMGCNGPTYHWLSLTLLVRDCLHNQWISSMYKRLFVPLGSKFSKNGYGSQVQDNAYRKVEAWPHCDLGLIWWICFTKESLEPCFFAWFCECLSN